MLRIGLEGVPGTQRRFTDLERSQLPFATMQAINEVAFEVSKSWEAEAKRALDRPSPTTQRAVVYKKATRENLEAQILIRDRAGKGTPPAQYLRPQVLGGTRRAKGLERGLQRAGLLFGNERAILGRGAPTDAYGNIRGGVVQQILSQVGGQFDAYANETRRSKQRNLRRGTRRAAVAAKNRQFFVVRGAGSRGYTVNRDGSTTQSRLRPGIYQRIESQRGGTVRPVFIFARGAKYGVRYDILPLAQREATQRLPAAFERQLARAVRTSKFNPANRR